MFRKNEEENVQDDPWWEEEEKPKHRGRKIAAAILALLVGPTVVLGVRGVLKEAKTLPPKDQAASTPVGTTPTAADVFFQNADGRSDVVVEGDAHTEQLQITIGSYAKSGNFPEYPGTNMSVVAEILFPEVPEATVKDGMSQLKALFEKWKDLEAQHVDSIDLLTRAGLETDWEQMLFQQLLDLPRDGEVGFTTMDSEPNPDWYSLVAALLDELKKLGVQNTSDFAWALKDHNGNPVPGAAVLLVNTNVLPGEATPTAPATESAPTASTAPAVMETDVNSDETRLLPVISLGDAMSLVDLPDPARQFLRASFPKEVQGIIKLENLSENDFSKVLNMYENFLRTKNLGLSNTELVERIMWMTGLSDSEKNLLLEVIRPDANLSIRSSADVTDPRFDLIKALLLTMIEEGNGVEIPLGAVYFPPYIILVIDTSNPSERVGVPVTPTPEVINNPPISANPYFITPSSLESHGITVTLPPEDTREVVAMVVADSSDTARSIAVEAWYWFQKAARLSKEFGWSPGNTDQELLRRISEAISDLAVDLELSQEAINFLCEYFGVERIDSALLANIQPTNKSIVAGEVAKYFLNSGIDPDIPHSISYFNDAAVLIRIGSAPPIE